MAQKRTWTFGGGLGPAGLNGTFSTTSANVVTDADRVRTLFAIVGSKRIFTDPVVDELPDLCVKAVLDFRDDATAIRGAAATTQLRKETALIVTACKTFLRAAGRDGVDFERDTPRFAVHLSSFRSAVTFACEHLADEYRVDLP